MESVITGIIGALNSSPSKAKRNIVTFDGWTIITAPAKVELRMNETEDAVLLQILIGNESFQIPGGGIGTFIPNFFNIFGPDNIVRFETYGRYRTPAGRLEEVWSRTGNITEGVATTITTKQIITDWSNEYLVLLGRGVVFKMTLPGNQMQL
jgi:hypothetical protein